MDHYRKVAEIPTLTFSPDADYPVVNSEKGIYHATMRCNAKTNIRINGGTRANVVCGKVKAFVPVEITEVEKHVSGILAKGFGVELEALANGTEITVIGLDAHGSMPELGKMQCRQLLQCLRNSRSRRGQTRYRHSSQQVRI